MSEVQEPANADALRKQVEADACECHRVLKNELLRLLG
jgi:hypothetical protein